MSRLPTRRRATVLVARALTVCGLAAGLVVPAATRAEATPVISRAGDPQIGFVWASQPTTASYAPPGSYSFNSTGGTNLVEREGPGLYAVTFPGIRPDDYDVQVTAYGDGTIFCNLNGNVNDGTSGTTDTLVVHVHCLDEDELAETDSRFVVSVQGQDGPSSLHGAGARFGSNNGWDGWNSSGGGFVKTTVAPGVYDVVIEDQTAAGANVQVTAVGTRPFGKWCNVAYWTQWGPDVRVRVMCWSVQWPTSSKFHLRFTTPHSAPIGYAWADRSTSSSYTPSTSYQWQGTTSTSSGATAGRLATGRHRVTFPDLSGVRTTATVTAYGGARVRCAIESWSSNSMAVTTRCRDAVAKIPVDSRFTTWVRAVPLVISVPWIPAEPIFGR